MLLMWKGLRSISVGKSWKYSGFICRGVGQTVSPLVSIVCERVTLLRLITELVSSWML